jgi:hypothetical protein
MVRKHSPATQLYHLGLSGSGPHGDLNQRLVESVHRALGIRCEKQAAATDGSSSRVEGSNRVNHGSRNGPRYVLHSSAGLVPIDRFNMWGVRKPDLMHPYFTAQLGLADLMLNLFCAVA